MLSEINAWLNQPHFFKKDGAGFTIIEILIVAFIIGILSVMLLLNFRAPNSNITARNQTVALIISNIRSAQTMTTNSTLFQGRAVCGYGVHYVSGNDNYLIYARQRPVGGCTGSGNRNFGQGVQGAAGDVIVQNIFLANPNFEIRASCPVGGLNKSFSLADIFFEPPDPKTYIDNDASFSGAPVDIVVRLKSSSNCNTRPYVVITVQQSGAIQCTKYEIDGNNYAC